MSLMEIFLISFVLLFGIITSYEDYKEHRIRNKWIIAALIYSFVVFVGASGYYYIQGIELNLNYIYDYFLNVLFALLAGLVIWFGGLWPAGDAKLFVAYAALVPLSVYQWGYMQHFPAFGILVNTFVPLFIFYFFGLMIKTTVKDKIEVIRGMLDLKFLLNNAVFIFAFLWVINLSLSLINKYTTLANNIFVIIALLFLIVFVFTNILKIDLLMISILISIVHLFFNYKDIFTIDYLKYFFVLLFLFIFLRYFIINLSHSFFSEPVYIEDLKEGMVPTENIIKIGKKYLKKKIVPMSFISGLIDNSEKGRLFHAISEGLDKEEIKRIQRLHSRGHIKEHKLMIANIVPFAPFMFFGVLVTILFKGNFIFYLIYIFQ